MRRRICIVLATVSILAGAAPCFAWKFASIADSRGSDNGVNTTVFGNIVNRVNTENVDLVIFQGDAVIGSSNDTTLGSQMDTWLSVINGLNCRWYWTPGNHEIAASTSEAVLRAKVDQPLNGPAGHEEMVFSVDHQSAHFAFVNSNHWNEYHHVQRSWLTTDLANTTQPHRFVNAHEPAYPKGPHIGSSLDVYASERNDFWNIMTNAKVDIFFCGHEHLYSRSLEGSMYQVINGTCGAPLATGGAGTISQYNYVIATVTGYSVHCDARNDSGNLIDSWDFTMAASTPAVSAPANGSTVTTVTPTISWNSPAHDAYQVRVTQVNDPNTVLNGWDSGQVSSAASSAVCGALGDRALYYIFVRAHSGSIWSSWSPVGHDLIVNTSATTAIYPCDYRPTISGWTVYDTGSYENGGGVKGIIVQDGGNYAWKLYDGSAANICKVKYPMTGVSFDTGVTLEARIRATGISGSPAHNLGISKNGTGGMYLRVSTDHAALVDPVGTVRGTFYLDGTTYHKYRLTVKNSTPGNDSTATWRVYVDGIERISWTGAGTADGFDGFMAGHAGTAATGYWYFDWIAGRTDGEFTPAQWNPVVPLDSAPPGPLTTFSAAPGDAEVNLAWTNPMDGNYTGTTVRYKTDGYPASPTDGSLVCDRANTPGSSDSFVHTGLANGVTCYYAAYAHDVISNYSAASNASATPMTATLNVFPGTVTVDGASTDWNLSDFVSPIRGGQGGVGDYALLGFDGGNLYYAGRYTGATLPTDAADHTARVYSRQDSDYLYLLMRCDDSDIQYPNALDSNWENDCIEIYIDPSHDRGPSPISDSTSDTQLVVDANNQVNVYGCAGGYKGQILAGVTSAVVRDGTGWLMEASIAKSALDPDLPAGGTFGLDFVFRDNDNSNDPALTTVYSWRDKTTGAGFPSKIPDNWGDGRIADFTPPGQASSFAAAAGPLGNTLTWTNPSDPDFTGVAILYKTTGYPANPSDGELLVDKLGSPGSPDSFVHYGVETGTTYFYSAFAHDGSANYAAGANASATVGCLSVWLNEAFDNYSNGDLGGQGGWATSAAASARIQSGYAKGGSGKSALVDPIASGGLSVGSQIMVSSKTSGYHYLSMDIAQDATGTGGQIIGYVTVYASDSATEITKLHIQKNRMFVEYGPGSLATLITTVANTTWYNVKIGFNVDTRKLDLWLDGAAKGAGYAWKGTGTNISRIVVSGDRNTNLNPQKIYVDNLRLEPKPAQLADVADGGDWTPSLTKLSFSYASVCAVEYQYAIGTTSGGTQVRNWTNCAAATSFTATGLALNENTTYYVSVQAGSGFGAWGATRTANGIKVAPGVATILAAKALADGAPAETKALRDKIVTAAFPGYFYIQEPDALCGLKALSSASVSAGNEIDVAGVMKGSNAERYIDCTGNATEVATPGPGTPETVILGNISIGGAGLNPYSPGIAGGVGPNNIGLLVTACGKVTQRQTSDPKYFYIDDGCGFEDGTTTGGVENVGIRIIADPASYAADSYVAVVGISSCFDSGGLRPQLLPTSILLLRP
ncbi:MAG: sugar-binding protein [Armatimonadota bacterium]|nr:sugar-binding protein [Armatimonadota bacterium]